MRELALICIALSFSQAAFAQSTPPSTGLNEQGQCLGEFQIFSGKALRCRVAGTQTVFKNCCKTRDGVLSDSMGNAGVNASVRVLDNVAESARAAASGDFEAATRTLLMSDPNVMATAQVTALLSELFGDQCDDRDTETAILNSSKNCVLLGDYCAEDAPIIGCVQRAQSYCCFNSKLARIIHEQGRAQLITMQQTEGGPFGTPEQPNCRGFRPEEFQALDFSKMDLSEYYEEIRAKSQALIQGEASEAARQKLNQ